MKRRVALICVFFLLLYGGSVFCAVAESKTKEDVEGAVGAEIEKYVDSLDLSDFENYLQTLQAPEELKGGVKGLIGRFVKGEIPLSVKGLLSYVANQALGALSGTLAALLTVVIIAVMNSILAGLTSGFVKKQTIEIVHYVCYTLVVSIVMAKVGGVVLECKAFCGGVERFTQGVFPPLITLMSALGGNVSASVYKPQLAVFCMVIGKVFGKVVLPLFIAS
ncbi:MAG: hypothetical protein IK037_02130, partial [Clostridia bacterium]|nr:hypothetical protein [Clostridia bacterium]